MCDLSGRAETKPESIIHLSVGSCAYASIHPIPAMTLPESSGILLRIEVGSMSVSVGLQAVGIRRPVTPETVMHHQSLNVHRSCILELSRTTGVKQACRPEPPGSISLEPH
jgi:hypothetical protein